MDYTKVPMIYKNGKLNLKASKDAIIISMRLNNLQGADAVQLAFDIALERKHPPTTCCCIAMAAVEMRDLRGRKNDNEPK